ncbi:DUF692 family protein [Plantactinospora sp. S1510]|uniref:DUF692 family protein n=1 Tax=Plantactinospora alkalitolerans TaxID=2789879 RepID=A0ABS0GW31_9ACTN|nr:DUF692 domain-containing protein [Plantactinospora alkalitolerans]MBF9130408.1 DUF692 family protein [Plantactinospora alkalitolerans]
MLGIGIGWRPEIDLTVERLPGVDFVEVIAERLRPPRTPESLRLLHARGVTVIPHGVGLGLGGAEPPDPARLAHLAACARLLGSPLVSEHIAVVRAGGVEAGHLLPVPRSRDCLDVLVENVRLAQAVLPVPLALENVAALFGWPDDDLTEGEFLAELVARTGVRLLVDVANLHTNRLNQAVDPLDILACLPWDALGYVHVAGGHHRDGVWHDTHTRPPSADIYRLLGELCAATRPPGVLLEWDGDYPSDEVLADTLGQIRQVVESTTCHRTGPTTGHRSRPATSHRTGPTTGHRSRPALDASAAPPEPVGSFPASARSASPVGGARDRLAERYAELLRTLVLAGPAPAGFDVERLRLQAEGLAARRRRHQHPQPS